MTADLPKLREDLTVSEQGSADDRFFVVKDAVRGQFFRLREPEYFIARQLDGATPVEVVRQRAEAKFDAQLSEEDLGFFVARLKKGGLLESETGLRPQRPVKRVQGSLLFLRCKILDPDLLFDRLIGKVRFLFTPGFVALSAACILMATFILIANWQEATASFSALYRFGAIPLIVLVVFLMITAHEFAHGLTCKHFGGHVNEIGFLLMYFQPAFYCNVSDAWMFPEKSKRLWVGFAGPYFELFLWSLATFAWRLTEPQTWINSMATVVIATSGIKTLLNFNPMIKWDGYYLLSDWVGIPNLRTKAFRYIGDKMKWFWGETVAPARQIPLRERRILLAYGLVAVVGSVSLLAITVATVGAQLVQQRQSLAFLLFAGLLGTRVRQRYRRLFGQSSGASNDPDDLDDPEQESEAATKSAKRHRTTEKAPAEITKDAHMTNASSVRSPSPVPSAKEGNGHGSPASEPARAAAIQNAEDGLEGIRQEHRTKPEKNKRLGRRRFIKLAGRFFKLAAVGGAAAAILLCVRTDLRVPGDFTVLPVRNADVHAEVEGIIEQICVHEGQLVQAGQLVARLSDRDVRADLERNAAQIEESRSRLKLLEAGSRPQEIEMARIAVAKAEEQLKFKRDRLGRDRQLYEEKLLSLNDYEESRGTVAGLESDLAEAKRKLDLLLAGSRVEEIEAMKAQVASLEAQRDFLADQLRRGRVVSLAAGVVTTPALQLKDLEHQLVKKGDLIAKVHDFQTITALIGVSEKEIADVRTGQSVRLKARAYPELVFDGKIIEIATTTQAAGAGATSVTGPSTLATAHASANTILVTTEIDNNAGFLKPGMTGMAKISCGERRLLDLVKRRLSRTLRVEFWSWW